MDDVHEMVIYGVSFDVIGKQPIVLLKTVDGNKFLPIWIGHPEAAAILIKLQGTELPRPMTHDLMTSLIEQFNAEVKRITVTALRDNTFYALLTLSRDGEDIEVDSRPSDALALAVRTDAPIFAAEDLIEENAIEFEHEVDDTEEIVERFRDFLDQVTPDDFRAEPGAEEADEKPTTKTKRKTTTSSTASSTKRERLTSPTAHSATRRESAMAAENDPVIKQFREQISDIDLKTLELINKRIKLVAQLWQYKHQHVEVYEPARRGLAADLRRARQQGAAHHRSPDEIYRHIIEVTQHEARARCSPPSSKPSGPTRASPDAARATPRLQRARDSAAPPAQAIGRSLGRLRQARLRAFQTSSHGQRRAHSSSRSRRRAVSAWRRPPAAARPGPRPRSRSRAAA